MLVTNSIRHICSQGGWQSDRLRFAVTSTFSRINTTLRHLRAMSSQAQEDARLQETPQNEHHREEKKHKSFQEIYKLEYVNLQLTEDSNPVCVKVIHPGLPPEALGRNGPSLRALLTMASAGRMYAMHVPSGDSGRTFIEYDRITDNHFTFFSSSLVNISARMYDASVPKYPLEIKVQGGHIGRTSMSTVSSMMSPSDPEREELMTQINQVVLVDRVTRRPTPIADKWRERYQSHCIRGEPLIIKRQDVPEGGPLSVYEVKVAWSDTDNYNHTNFASYPRFAVDAVHDALRLGKLQKYISEAEVSAGVSQVKMAYLGESVEADVLKIQVWCPEDCQRTVVCSMEKEGQVVNQVTLTFHTPRDQH